MTGSSLLGLMAGSGMVLLGTSRLEQLVEPENPLVDSMVAQKAVEDLRSKGFTFRQISRLAGVSVEAVHRSSAGVGRIRSSTEQALLQVASSLTSGYGRRG